MPIIASIARVAIKTSLSNHLFKILNDGDVRSSKSASVSDFRASAFNKDALKPGSRRTHNKRLIKPPFNAPMALDGEVSKRGSRQPARRANCFSYFGKFSASAFENLAISFAFFSAFVPIVKDRVSFFHRSFRSGVYEDGSLGSTLSPNS